MQPKKLILNWVEAFNAADAERLSTFYHEEAINHQVPEQPINGKKAIRERFEQEFKVAEMVCIIEHIFEDGPWAILEWKDPLGLRGCGFFKIEKGKIILQRGYWDKLSFLRQHKLPLPTK